LAVARRFRGESVNKVDQKGRVSIPAPFRRVLEEGDPEWAPGLNPNLVIVYGRKQTCLECFSIRGMEEIDNLIAKLPRFSRKREALERAVHTKSVYAQVDENGRTVLPQRLREMIGIGDEAFFAGMGDKFQIWEPNAYAADQAQFDDWVAEEGDPFADLGAEGGA